MPTVEIPSQIQLEGTGFLLDRISAASADTIAGLVALAKFDDAIQSEFPGTIKAYDKPTEQIRDRLRQMYDAEPHQRIGYLILAESNFRPAGMTYVGARAEGKVFAHDGSITPFRGINFSSFLLPAARGAGIMTAHGEHINQLVRQLGTSENPRDAEWAQGILYTGIRDGNIASERAVTRRGYQPMGVLLHDTAYRGWFRPDEWHRYKTAAEQA